MKAPNHQFRLNGWLNKEEVKEVRIPKEAQLVGNSPNKNTLLHRATAEFINQKCLGPRLMTQLTNAKRLKKKAKTHGTRKCKS